MLNGSLRELESFSRAKRAHVLKSLIALSKYLGVYEKFKRKIKSYGIKWEKQSALDSFLRMVRVKEGLMDWVRECTRLDGNLATFIEFLMVTGMRKGEAIKSFNLIIKLAKKGKLDEYYDFELKSLEHFKFKEEFLRRTKNVFFSFVPEDIVKKITNCRPINETWIKRKIRKNGLKLRMNELRSYFATFMVKNGLIREEVDILQGRMGTSIFMRHYFSPQIYELRNRVLEAIGKMRRELSN